MNLISINCLICFENLVFAFEHTVTFDCERRVYKHTEGVDNIDRCAIVNEHDTLFGMSCL